MAEEKDEMKNEKNETYYEGVREFAKKKKKKKKKKKNGCPKKKKKKKKKG